MSSEKSYDTNWGDTLVVLIFGDLIFYFVGAAHSGITNTLLVLGVFSAFIGELIYEKYKWWYLRMDKKWITSRDGLFSTTVQISLSALQGMRAIQDSLIYQPNLEIEYLTFEGERRKLVLNTYAYQHSLIQFLKDVQQIKPNIEVDDVCQKAIEKGKWPLLPVRDAQ
jgi:hypothetical protein